MEGYEREDIENSQDWARLAEIALPRFSELQRGESISRREIAQRLRELRQAGYSVRTEGSKDELWKELSEAKKYIRTQATQYAPATLREIERQNKLRLHRLRA